MLMGLKVRYFYDDFYPKIVLQIEHNPDQNLIRHLKKIEIDVLILIFLWKYKSQNNQNNLEESLRFLPGFKIYYKVIVIRTVNYWQIYSTRSTE